MLVINRVAVVLNSEHSLSENLLLARLFYLRFFISSHEWLMVMLPVTNHGL